MERHRYDVFFSYAWEDLAQATEIVEELRGLGLEVFQDFSQMRDYDDITEEIEAALRGSRSLVALYTPDFLPSAYCRLELYTALTRGYQLDRGTPRVFPLVRGMEFEEVRPRHLTGLRLPERGASVTDLARSVAAKVAELDGRRLGDAPEPAAPHWYPYAPLATRPFFGRLRELWDVHDALLATADGSEHGPAVARITGLGGQGKTALAEQYALTFAADHPGGTFLLRGFGSHRNAKGNTARLVALRNSQVARIAALMGIDVTGRSPEWIDGRLRRRLDARGLPYLWIVDDLPAGIDAYACATLFAPTGAGRTLVTTRHDAHYRWGERIMLGGLDDSAACGLLTSRRPPVGAGERREARALADDLAGHALALTVAAGLTAQPDFAGYARLRAAIAAPGPDVLRVRQELDSELPGDHGAGIAATFLRSMSKLTSAGRDVLRLASLLAPAPVPERLFALVLEEASQDGDARAAAGLADARSRSLTSAEPGPGDAGPSRFKEAPLWSVHALVSRVVRAADLDDGWQAAMHTAGIAACIRLLDGSRADESPRWLAPYLPHVRALAGQAANEDSRHLLNEAGRAHLELGDTATALRTFTTLYEACRDALGPADITTLTAAAGLGVAYGLQGHHDQALTLKRLAYQGLKDKLGEDDPDVLTALNNLAVTCSDTGDHRAARLVYAGVYRARRRLLQSQHPDTIAALGNVAVAAGQEGNHRLALRLKRGAYRRNRSVYGPSHPATLYALHSVGVSEDAVGDPQAAHRTFAEVHRMRAEVLGPRHPDTLTALENAAVTSGDDEQALAILEQVYRDRLAAQGPAHPQALRTLRTLLAWRARSLGPDSGTSPPRTRMPTADPAGGLLRTARLDDPVMDSRVATFELACRIHESAAALAGDASVEALWYRCLLAHATAALDQLDRQYEDALVLIEDAVAGLVEALSAHHERTRAAGLLREWIEELAIPS